jgi:ABC-type Fe3+-hydroxamate transport system substrate-binding protein
VTNILILLVIISGSFLHAYDRVISLSPRLTSSIYLLGADEKLIANTIFCTTPEEANTKEKIGDLVNINLEKILRLKPDLVLVSPLAKKKKIQKLNQLGIKTEFFPQPKTYQQLTEQFLKLGALVGKLQKATDINIMMKKEIQKLSRTTHRKQPKVFFQVGSNPLFTITKSSYLNDYIELAGGINVAKNARNGQYSKEAVIKSNPDIIFIMLMGITGETEKKEWEKYPIIDAVRHQRIYLMDPYKFGSPTPITFVETLWEIKDLITKK